MHHAANGIITFDSATRARGSWSLFFHNINLAGRTLTQMGVEYDDVYVKDGDRWRATRWRAGDIVTTGSCTPPVFAAEGARVTGEIDGLGRLELTL